MAAAASRRIPAITARFWVTKTLITAASVFWPDYPLGAAVAFLLTNESAAGGFGLGRSVVSAVLTAVLVGSVAYR